MRALRSIILSYSQLQKILKYGCKPREGNMSENERDGRATRGPSQVSMRLLVANRPHIGCHCRQIGLRELGAPHGRHHTGVFLGLRYAAGDRPGYRPDAAVAP